MSDLTHQNPKDGSLRMVDVSTKRITQRIAIAEGFVAMREDVCALLMAGKTPKGEALAAARVAGVMAAKNTGMLIPLCHPLPLDVVEVSFEAAQTEVRVLVKVAATARTGVEMEALTAASMTCLTLYDMVKGLDKSAQVRSVRLLYKEGGKSGVYCVPGFTPP